MREERRQRTPFAKLQPRPQDDVVTAERLQPGKRWDVGTSSKPIEQVSRGMTDGCVANHRLAPTSNSVYGVNVCNGIQKDIRNINSLKSSRTKYKLCLIDSSNKSHGVAA